MTEESISPLRRRMIEDMEVRGFTACTQRGYIAAVQNFTAFLGRAPDQADKEDLRRFQHHMRTQGASAANMNLAVSGLRFPATAGRPLRPARSFRAARIRPWATMAAGRAC